MAVQRTVLYPFVFHTSYVSTYHCHKNKSVFGYEGHSIDFGIEAQKLELKQKMAVATSKKKHRQIWAVITLASLVALANALFISPQPSNSRNDYEEEAKKRNMMKH